VLVADGGEFGPYNIYFFAHPDDVQQVLQSNAGNYQRKPKRINHVKRLLGESIFTSEGTVWQRQRQEVQVFFGRSEMAQKIPMMVSRVKSILADWRNHIGVEHVMDLWAAMDRMTLDIFADTMMGVDIDRYVERIRAARDTLAPMTYRRIQSVFNLPLWIPTAENRRFQEAMNEITGVISEAMDEFKDRQNVPENILSFLLSDEDDKSGLGTRRWSTTGRVLSFFSIGYEMPALGLTWAWYLISRHPEIEEKLYREVDEVLGGRARSGRSGILTAPSTGRGEECGDLLPRLGGHSCAVAWLRPLAWRSWLC